jgi:hypothetical protein
VVSKRADRTSLKISSADAKRTASGKFEKNQVQPLTEWLLKHSSNPYPSMDDKADLAMKSGLSTQQVQNWFINMRKRHWTPMMNGKRRPRTFLDYVILSSQTGDKDGKSVKVLKNIVIVNFLVSTHISRQVPMMVDDGGPMMLRPDDDDWGG